MFSPSVWLPVTLGDLQRVNVITVSRILTSLDSRSCATTIIFNMHSVCTSSTSSQTHLVETITQKMTRLDSVTVKNYYTLAGQLTAAGLHVIHEDCDEEKEGQEGVVKLKLRPTASIAAAGTT